jgi:hypothetical protein
MSSVCYYSFIVAQGSSIDKESNDPKFFDPDIFFGTQNSCFKFKVEVLAAVSVIYLALIGQFY